MKQLYKVMNQPYLISWRDVSSDSKWRTPEDAKEWARVEFATPCGSVCWILEENRNYLITAASKNNSGEYGEIIMIPKSLIVRKEKL